MLRHRRLADRHASPQIARVHAPTCELLEHAATRRIRQRLEDVTLHAGQISTYLCDTQAASRLRAEMKKLARDGPRPRRELWERMARTDFRTPRLYVPQDLAAGIEVKLDPQQTNYLVNVLRLSAGAPVLLFNGRDGEFSASLNTSSRKAASLVVGTQTRAQEQPPDVDYLFAPLKHARLDYMAQKAIEMGARRLRPVVTRHTQVARVNLERLRANAIEACEQCGVIWTPEIVPVQPLAEALKSWPAERLLVFCDEEAEPNECARRARKRARGQRRRPPDRAGRRIRRRRARCDPLGAARAAPEPGAAHPPGRHRRRGGPGAHSGHAGRLAEKTHPALD